MNERRYDLIAFDWDGTLFDSTALIVRCIQDACRDVGAPVPAAGDAAYVIGLGLHDALRHVVPDLPLARHRELGERFSVHYALRQHEPSLFAGTEPMLRALRERHHWLAVATGKGRRGLDVALEQAQLRELFDATRTADETASKPNPRMLLELMQHFGVEPERALMIGDTTHDLLLAANAGVASVAVSFGAHDHAAFADYQPLVVVHSTAELHEWLLEHA